MSEYVCVRQACSTRLTAVLGVCSTRLTAVLGGLDEALEGRARMHLDAEHQRRLEQDALQRADTDVVDSACYNKSRASGTNGQYTSKVLP